MTAAARRLSKGLHRHRSDRAVVAYSDTVAVTFRLFDKLASDGKTGTFKQPARSALHKNRPKTHPFWLFLFQDGGDQVCLTHEVFVDEDGCYHHTGETRQGQATDSSQAATWPNQLLVQRAFRRKSSTWSYAYYALLSPFRVQRTRLDPILPGGKTKKGDHQAREQFLSWAKLRELNKLVFTPAEGSYGAVRELWAPWLKAHALADEHDAALHQFAKEYVDQTDKIELANLIARWSRVYRLDDYVSVANIEALFNAVLRIVTMTQESSARVTEYVATAPFADMILDMWEDKSGGALVDLAPFLANIYRAVNLTQLRDMVDKRYFDIDLDWDRFDVLKAVRRLMKPIWEIHACFAKALTYQAKHPDARLDWYVDASRKYSEALFKTKLQWDGKRWEWDSQQAAQLRRGRYVPAVFNIFLGFLDIYNSFAAIESFRKDPSERARIAALSAFASQVSNFLRIVDLTLPEASEIGLKKVLVRLRGGNLLLPKLSPQEETILRRLARREAAYQWLRLKPLARPLTGSVGLLDAFAAYVDLRAALQTANSSGAIWSAVAMLGSICVAASAIFTGQFFWLAFAGQTLLLAGSLGGSVSQDSPLELWMKFCRFGKLSSSADVAAPSPWGQGLSLGAFACSSVREQIEVYKRIIFQADVSARRICHERVNDQFELSLTFPYGVPRTTRFYCRIELLREDGSRLVARPLAALEPGADTVVFRYSDTGKDTVMGLLLLLDDTQVMFATEEITVAIWMDITGFYDFYPSEAIIKSFKVDGLKS